MDNAHIMSANGTVYLVIHKFESVSVGCVLQAHSVQIFGAKLSVPIDGSRLGTHVYLARTHGPDWRHHPCRLMKRVGLRSAPGQVGSDQAARFKYTGKKLAVWIWPGIHYAHSFTYYTRRHDRYLLMCKIKLIYYLLIFIKVYAKS